LAHVNAVGGSIGAGLALPQVHDVIGSHLSHIPGAEDIVKDFLARAQAGGEAIGQLIAAVDLKGVVDAAQNGSTGAPVDLAGLKKAIAKLGAAAAVAPLVDKVEKLLTDKSIQALVKSESAKAGLVGGIDDVRGALKSVTPSTIGVSSQIASVIAAVKNHGKAAGSDAAKALDDVSGDLTKIHKDFDAQVVRLLSVIDTALATTFN
jgi:hypothetical protein